MKTLNYNPRKEEIYERRNFDTPSMKEIYQTAEDAPQKETERVANLRRKIAHEIINR
ncbi:hypothetical protein HN903_00755 [archaeon]|jgi:hypothetical protein|nr:hypothetical protein [archaeon]MBT7128261.1 hypothetical protein [archaeon]